MTPDELVEQLLALPDVEAQKQFLDEHTSLLDDQVAETLKAKIDHFVRADNQQAMHLVELLYRVADLTGEPVHRALGLRAEGNVCLIGQGEFQKAIDLYDEAALIYKGQGRPVDQAKAQVGKVDALSFLGHHTEALEVGEWGSQILKDHGEWHTLAVLTMSLGNARFHTGDDAGSLEMYDRAASLYSQLDVEGKPPWLLVQHNRAIALCTLGRFEESIHASREA
jgi:tetratricopeptide (TPR) repeat protein